MISDHQKMSLPSTVDSLFYTCLFINTEQESSSEPMSSEKDMAIAELPDVCAVVEVATENEEPEVRPTEVSLPLQDSHVSSYSGNVLSCLYLYLLLCYIHHRSHKLLITCYWHHHGGFCSVLYREWHREHMQRRRLSTGMYIFKYNILYFKI